MVGSVMSSQNTSPGGGNTWPLRSLLSLVRWPYPFSYQRCAFVRVRSSPWLAGWGWHSDGIFGQQHAEVGVHASVQRLFLILSRDSSTEVSQKRTPSTKMYEHDTVFHTFLKCLIRLFGGMTPNSALYQEWWSLVRSDCVRLWGPIFLCLHCKTSGIRPAKNKNNSNTKQTPNKQTNQTCSIRKETSCSWEGLFKTKFSWPKNRLFLCRGCFWYSISEHAKALRIQKFMADASRNSVNCKNSHVPSWGGRRFNLPQFRFPCVIWDTIVCHGSFSEVFIFK